MPTVRRIVRDAKAHNDTFESIVMGVVNSDAFRGARRQHLQPALKTASIDSHLEPEASRPCSLPRSIFPAARS